MCMDCKYHKWCLDYFKKHLERCECRDIKAITKFKQPTTYESFALWVSIINGDFEQGSTLAYDRKTKYRKICECCGKEFKTYNRDKKYCTVYCEYKHTHQKERTKHCETCGKLFVGKSKMQVFCCHECKVIGEGKRRKARRKEMAKKNDN